MAAPARFRAFVLNKARENLAINNHGTAFSHYLLAIKIDHDLSSEILDEFVLCMCHWTDLLCCLGQQDDVTLAFSQARAVCCLSDTLMCALGEQALRLEKFSTAVCLMQEAEQSFPQSIAVQETWEHVSYGAVERWHFKMLNDLQRNKAYHDAIIHTVRKNNVSSVLDIGCGTGLLSVFAEKGGAEQVSMCDASPVMIEVCSAVMSDYHQESQSTSQLRIFDARSTSLTVPKHLPQKVDLVVTEIFDAALFGEHCLSTLSHAWSHLLNNTENKKGRVVPGTAQLYVCAIECPEIRKENCVQPACIPLLDLSEVSIISRTAATEEEPYTTEDLYCIRNSYRFLSPIHTLMTVDFNHPEALEELTNHTAKFVLDIYAEGAVDALAIWFDLDLCEGVKVSTAPSATCCWEQAIFPVMSVEQRDGDSGMKVFHMSPKVNCGDQLKIRCELSDGCLRLALDEIVALGYFLNTCHISPPPPAAASACASVASGADRDSDSHQCSQAVVNGGASRESLEQEQGQEQTVCSENKGEALVVSDGDLFDLHQSLATRKRTGCAREAVTKNDELCDHSTEEGQSSVQETACITTQCRQSSVQETACITTQSRQSLVLETSCITTQCRQSSVQKTGCITTQCSPPVVACRKESPGSGQVQEENEKNYSQFAAEVASLENGRILKAGRTKSSLNSVVVADDGNLETCLAVSDTECVALSCDIHRDLCPSLMELEDDCEPSFRHEKDTTDSSASDCAHSPAHPGSSNNNSNVLTSQHPLTAPTPHKKHSRGDSHSSTFRLHREEVRHLNDRKFSSLCLSALRHAGTCVKSPGRLMNISSGFPVQGLLGLKLGFRVADLCYVGHGDGQEMQSLVDSIWKSNSVTGSRWNWLEGTVEEVVDGYEGGVKLDLVSVDVVDMAGSLRSGLLDELRALRPVLSETTVVVPQAVDVYAVLIHSPQLLNMSCVTSDQNTLGVSIASHINPFRTRTFLDLDIHALPHKILSDVTHVFCLDIQSSMTSSPPSNQAADASAESAAVTVECRKGLDGIFSQFKQLRLTARKSGHATAMVFWFDLTLAPGVNASTVDPEMNWRQAAYVLDGGRVEEGQEVVVEARLEKSYLHFRLRGRSGLADV